jgi:hypothetical protein
MHRLIAVVWLCWAGCGGDPLAASYVPRSGTTLPAFPSGIPASTPVFLIDASVGANIPVGAFGITTNGTTWYLEWQTDSTSHRFSGDIYCPQSCKQTFVSFDRILPTGSINQIAPNHFHFDDQTDARTHRHLEFDTTMQPVSFSLIVDGQPAVNSLTTFISSGQRSTVDAMPFALVSSNVTPKML